MNEDELERNLRDAVAAETEPVRVDEHASLTTIRQRATAARRRRLVGATALGAAAALVIGIGIGAAVGRDGDDHTNVATGGPRTTIGGDCASTTAPATITTTAPSRTIVEHDGTSIVVPPETSVPVETTGDLTNGDGCGDPTTASSEPPTTPTVSVPTTTTTLQADEPAVYPQADDTRNEAERKDPVATARTFLVDVIGISDPALGPFRSTDADHGTISLFNGHGQPQPGAVERSSLALARRASGDWVILSARSDAIDASAISTGQDGSSLSVSVSGKGRGFEGVLHVTVAGDGSVSSGTTMASGGLDLAPFEAKVLLGGDPHSIAVIVTNDSGEEGGAVDIAARAIAIP